MPCHTKVTKITGTINRNENRSFLFIIIKGSEVYLSSSSKEANYGPISIGHPFPSLFVKSAYFAKVLLVSVHVNP
jgi:hypothetical protein